MEVYMSDQKRQRRPMHRRYSDQEKQSIIRDYYKSGLTRAEYCQKAECSPGSISRWIKEGNSNKNPDRPHYSPEQRREAVEAYLESGLSLIDFGQMWDLNPKTLTNWIARYNKEGPKGLESGNLYGSGKKRGPKGLKSIIKDKIKEAQKDFPDFGLKKLQQNLKRFQGIKVSPNTIKKVLNENDEYIPKSSERKRKSPAQIRRFERANPMQLWQSDITSFVLGRSGQRVYLVVFMDDNSRYIVSWALSVKQTGQFVIDTLYDGFQKFGKPEEVLTDQGRQYFSWRGKSEFQKLLHKECIHHVVARSHHPQTVGKCERFWKTVGKEFWDRANPRDLDEARERFTHFVNHYNHFRPHQGLDGMIPADRFFKLEDEVRYQIESTLVDNELRLAINQAPRKPVFIVGQIGEQKISMHGEEGKLVVNSPCGLKQMLNYDELGHKTVGEKDGEQYNIAKHKEEKRSPTLNELLQARTAGESIVGDGERRGEVESERAGASSRTVLDGIDDKERSLRETRSESFEDVADRSASSVGNVCSSFEATEKKEDLYESRRRSEISQEEDKRVGEDDYGTESLDRSFEDDAGMPTCASSSCSEGEKEWEEDQEGTVKESESKWENFYSEKEEE